MLSSIGPQLRRSITRMPPLRLALIDWAVAWIDGVTPKSGGVEASPIESISDSGPPPVTTRVSTRVDVSRAASGQKPRLVPSRDAGPVRGSIVTFGIWWGAWDCRLRLYSIEQRRSGAPRIEQPHPKRSQRHFRACLYVASMGEIRDSRAPKGECRLNHNNKLHLPLKQTRRRACFHLSP